MKIKEIKEIIKDNKKEIILFGGSVLVFGIGVYCVTKSAKMNLSSDISLSEQMSTWKGDILKDKAIHGMLATVEWEL